MARLARLIDPLHGLKRRLGSQSDHGDGVLIVAAGGLGDTVLFAHVLPEYLPLARAGEQVTVLLRSDGAKTAFLFPDDVERLKVNFSRLDRDAGYRWRVFEDLNRRRFRLVISADFLRHPHLDEALIVATGAPEKAAMVARPWAKYDTALARRRSMYTRLFDSGPALTDKVIRWSRFAGWLGDRDVAAPALNLPADRLPAPEALEKPMVVIQPFSAVTAKQPGLEVFRAIVEAIPADTDIRFTGTPADVERNPAFRDFFDEAPVTFDASSFKDLVPRLRAARLVISVDTALMHLAVAVGAKTLCLGSAAYVGEIVPYAAEITPANVTFLYHDMPCRGCLGHCIHPLEDGQFPCVAGLAKETVVDKVAALMGDGPAGTRL